MRERAKLPVLAVFALMAGLSAPARPAGPYDFGNPSPDEEWMRFLINRARTGPEAEADRLGLDNIHPDDVPDGTYDVGEGITITGVSNQRVYWSRYQGPRQVLAWNAALNTAAISHSEDMHEFDFWGHYTDQSSHGYPYGAAPWDRAYAEGYPNHFAGENIACGYPAGYHSAGDMHDGFFDEPDYPGRGHRKNMLHSFWREVGVGYYSGPPNAGGWTDYWTIDFGSDAFRPDAGDPNPAVDTVYVTGVAFDDDGDGVYEPGEQMPGVRVLVYCAGAQLKHYAVTAAGGGYSVPLLEADGSDVAEGRQIDVIFFDRAAMRYLKVTRTVQGGEVVFEDTDSEIPDSEHQRFNVGVNVLAADFEPVADGDANFDGVVDYMDLGILATNYDLSGKDWPDGDFTGNGVVDYMDLGILATNYDSMGGEGTPVPEPAAVSLLILGGAALVRRRRRMLA